MKKEKKRIVRKFVVNDPYQGIAGMLAGTSVDGLHLLSMERKGNKVKAVYGTK